MNLPRGFLTAFFIITAVGFAAPSEADACSCCGNKERSVPPAAFRSPSQAQPSADRRETRGRTIELSLGEEGFQPNRVSLKKGEPVTLVITRRTDQTCAKEIVIDEYGISTKLPLNKAVAVSFTPGKTGELRYGCAMGKMVGGVLVVQ